MTSFSIRLLRNLFGLLVLGLLISCKPATEEILPVVSSKEEGELVRVGSIAVTQADLEFQLKEKHGGRNDEASRKGALDELAERAMWTQAAIDAGLDADPLFRDEMARVLRSRYREEILFPLLKEASAPIPESRLAEIYAAQAERFQSPEKRQVAVLWLNPGKDPSRSKQYQEKLAEARRWFLEESNLLDQPEAGFSVLSVDYSEHAATRFKGGVLGWIDSTGGSSDWTRAVSKIVFSLEETGEVSPVVADPEGIFLVRLMALKPGMQKSFAAVRNTLEREEQDRLRIQIEKEFEASLRDRYPVNSK